MYIMGLLQDFKDFRTYEIKDELNHFEEKFAKNMQIFLFKRSNLPPVKLFRLHPG
jgi:hypothetical protein